ncbi:MAG: M48 family metalloprotease [Acidobacteria bacterium]|nr:M48 family metalloprotease [Acidobacteriota bacterium]
MNPRVIVPVALLALVAACATNPVTGRRELTFMSEAQEISIAQESDPEIKKEMGVYNDPELQRYVNEIGQRMAKISERPHLPWRFTVVDVPAVNAFAVPGGGIYITRGILPFLDSEAELAGVIGHEIGHVTARHSAQQYTRQITGQVGLLALGIFVPAARPFGDLTGQALGVLFLKYGRDDEIQADGLGARYESTLGWDPAAMPGFLSTLGRLDEAAGDRRGVPNWLSTHPDPLSRVDDIQPTVQKIKAAGGSFATNRDALIQRIDGILYGDNPEQGLARGSAFLHPVLRFRIDFPDQWEIANSPQEVVAKAPGADIFMLLELVEKPQGRTIEEIALNSMGNAGFRASRGERASINGLDAFVGVYQGQVEGLGAVVTRAAHIMYEGKVYVVAGLVPPGAFQQADGAFLASIRSFRRLSAKEAEDIHPDRVDLYVVRAGDTWQSIAERSGGAIKPATLAIMNNATPGSQPQQGTRIKIVVRG